MYHNAPLWVRHNPAMQDDKGSQKLNSLWHDIEQWQDQLILVWNTYVDNDEIDQLCYLLLKVEEWILILTGLCKVTRIKKHSIAQGK